MYAPAFSVQWKVAGLWVAGTPRVGRCAVTDLTALPSPDEGRPRANSPASLASEVTGRPLPLLYQARERSAELVIKRKSLNQRDLLGRVGHFLHRLSYRVRRRYASKLLPH